MFSVIAGNICSLLATAADSLSASQKTAKRVLYMQTLAQCIYGIGMLFLKGYSAVVQNVISVIRNLAATKQAERKWFEWMLVILGVVFGLFFNNRGLIGILPVLANLEYSLCVFRFRGNEQALKISYLVCIALFMVFNAAILNFVGAGLNLVIFITTLLFVLKGKKEAAAES